MTDKEFFNEIQKRTGASTTTTNNTESCVLHNIMKEWEPYIGTCPRCGSNDIEYQTDMILTSNPPKLRLRCKDCGNYFFSSPLESRCISSDSLDNIVAPTIVDPLPGQTPYFGDFPNSPYLGGNQGWICPKCGRVMAPHMDYCKFCSSNLVTINTNKLEGNDTLNLKDILENDKNSISAGPYDPFFYETRLTNDQSQFNYITTTNSEMNKTNKTVTAKNDESYSLNDLMKKKFLDESESVMEAVDKYIQWEKEQKKQ